MGEQGELTPQTTGSEVRALVGSARQSGIQLSSLSTAPGWKCPIISPDPAAREQGAENIAVGLRLARWLGVDTLLCVPGIVSAEIPYDAAYERARDVLKELASVAAAERVAIGIESVWNKFLLSPLEMARFIDEIGSEWVGAYFDAGNVLVYGYPQHWIRILGRRIRKVHVKDFRANIGNGTAFCNPLQGDLPWAAVREALEAVGYDDFVTAEVDGYRVHAELGLRHLAGALRAVFG